MTRLGMWITFNNSNVAGTRVFFCCLWLVLLLFRAHRAWAESSPADTMLVTLSASEGLVLQGQNARITVGLDAEVGMVYDRALYASFGLEGQIARFSKYVLPIKALFRGLTDDHYWEGVLELAPWYDSIRQELQTQQKIYLRKGEAAWDGATVYRDWYKNLGSRLYFLGEIPVLQAFGSYTAPWGTVALGRMKNLVGLDDNLMPWRDDGKMAPMGYWLSKDLLTGAVYRIHRGIIHGALGLFSGHNPLKSGAAYLHRNGVQSPNTKANNTATYTGSLHLKGHPGAGWLASLGGGYQRAIAGSTWHDALEDGKRNAHVGTIEGLLTWQSPTLSWVKRVDFFVQGTLFESGLRPNSVQNKGESRYRTVRQKGGFAGVEASLSRPLSLWVAAEWIDRFDGHLLALGGYQTNDPMGKAKQHSVIFGQRYTVTPGIQLTWACHLLKNPAQYASHVLSTHGNNRWKLTVESVF